MNMNFSTTPWWQSDEYLDDSALGMMPIGDADVWGPKGPALVKLWNDGRTQTGWGRDAFMTEYKRQNFLLNRILHGYVKGTWNFAWIMRSARIVCIDIDGKNGGFENASELGYLPPTLSETSKSGNGYHLFYLTDDEWDVNDGFAGFRDHIGLVTGVDIRGTGCVYHYPTQRWNDRQIVKLPAHLEQKLKKKHQQRQHASMVIQKTLALDPEEIAIMHDELITELSKPVPTGKRNNTLFAIGSKMAEAKVPDWQTLVGDRAVAVGLDEEEVDKLITNIGRYA